MPIPEIPSVVMGAVFDAVSTTKHYWWDVDSLMNTSDFLLFSPAEYVKPVKIIRDKYCSACGILFNPGMSHRSRCSKCRHYDENVGVLVEKTCLACGKTFNIQKRYIQGAKNKNSYNYCSYECRWGRPRKKAAGLFWDKKMGWVVVIQIRKARLRWRLGKTLKEEYAEELAVTFRAAIYERYADPSREWLAVCKSRLNQLKEELRKRSVP